jgi:hypothetical protein
VNIGGMVEMAKSHRPSTFLLISLPSFVGGGGGGVFGYSWRDHEG